MQAWDSIQTTLRWIEDNLSEHMDMEELAKRAHLSPFYYQRLFSRLVGKPVMEYVKLRRLANAAEHLASSPGRIIDAALSFGFESHETFSRAFKAAYGLTPEEYRASPRPLSHFLVPELSLQYTLVDENVPLLAEGIVLEVRRACAEARRFFTGYTIQNPIADTPGIDYLGELWDRFHRDKGLVSDLLPDGHERGVSYPGLREGCFSYFAGAETTGDVQQPGFDQWELPTGEYAVCSFEAENFYLLTTNALNKARDYLLGVWLPRHKLAIEPFMAEVYYSTTPEATRMEIWLKIKVSE